MDIVGCECPPAIGEAVLEHTVCGRAGNYNASYHIAEKSVDERVKMLEDRIKKVEEKSK